LALIIVESPTKIKTLAKILGGDWDFAATRGHLYDLPSDEMGIADDYSPCWVPIRRRGNQKTINNLKRKAKTAEKIYLATDPDREGEAIAWQVSELVLAADRPPPRLRLEGLTSENVEAQLKAPEDIDWDMVFSQWARRLLDRLAGYKISPFLMSAFKGKKLSAGRVQTAVLNRIVERWQAVDEFEPVKFYRLLLELRGKNKKITPPPVAELVQLGDCKIGTSADEELITERKTVEELAEAVREKGVQVKNREVKETQTNPAFPFDSSELIRRASSWFGWPASQTMSVAQKLYEKGLITYHRSDSNRLSRSGCKQAAAYICDKFGKEHRQWRQGGGGDQEGHEAIRAQYAGLLPEELHSVSSAERTLYGAIWQRYIRSQMKAARWKKLILTLQPAEAEPRALFKAELRTNIDPGFYRCRRKNEETPPEQEYDREQFEQLLDQEPSVDKIDIKESKTKGPELFTEGAIVQMMKKEGIGRPSTYAATLKKLQRRQYVKTDNKKIVPTRRGIDVICFLKRAIPKICDIRLTEDMEEALDRIAEGSLEWRDFLKDFDEKLTGWLEAGADIEPQGTAETEKEELQYAECPRCGGNLISRRGQYGKFVHCDREDCDFTSNLPAKSYSCPICERHMVKQKGSRSAVYHCLAHPDCEGRRPVGKPKMNYSELQENIGPCPECGAKMDRRKGRYGYFWGCSKYPECKGTKTEK